MDAFERRVAEHFGDSANNLSIAPAAAIEIQPLAEVRRRGASRQDTLRRGLGGGAPASVFVGGLAVTAMRNDDGVASSDSPATSYPTNATPNLSDVPPAIKVEPTIEWTAVNADEAPGYNWHSWVGASFSYVVSSAPGVPDGSGRFPQEINQVSADGTTATAIGGSFDRWILDLDGSTLGEIYAIGTAPTASGDDWNVVAGRSDGTDAIVRNNLPVDVAELRDALGGPDPWLRTQIEGTGDTVVALVQGSAAASIAGVTAPFGLQFSDSGIDVFGPITDLTADVEGVCPEGWLLRAGSPQPGPLDTGPTTTTIAPKSTDPGIAQSFYCDAPEDLNDLYVDPSQIARPIVRSLTFAEAGLSLESGRLLAGQLVVYVSTDAGATWTMSPSQMPTISPNGATIDLFAHDNGFAISVLQPQPELMLSGDGRTWSSVALPSFTSPPVQLVDGTWLQLDSLGGRVHAHTTTDLATWTTRDVTAVMNLPEHWSVGWGQTIAGPPGAAFVVTAQQDLASVAAAAGELIIDHGTLQLQQLNLQESFALYDGEGVLLDTITRTWDGVTTSANGWIRADRRGLLIIDPESGDPIDSFPNAEIFATIERLNQQLEQGSLSQTYVLDTQDGVSWASTPLSELGIGTNFWWHNTMSGTDALVIYFAADNGNVNGDDTYNRVQLIGRAR
jgi:hypothetical protein